MRESGIMQQLREWKRWLGLAREEGEKDPIEPEARGLLPMVNRSAVVLRPKGPCLSWAELLGESPLPAPKRGRAEEVPPEFRELSTRVQGNGISLELAVLFSAFFADSDSVT